MPVSRQVSVINWKQGDQESCNDEVAAEVPVALTYNKRSHVVMMATPTELADFATGFSLTEGIIEKAEDIQRTAVIEREKGLELAITINQTCFAQIESQRRNLVGRTGCGLCGAESLDQAIHHPATVGGLVSVSNAALQNAIRSLNDHQPLQAATGALHGAAWCNVDGEILCVREDVGRHNALDKLIGHLSRNYIKTDQGFALVSSRASYEMVYKAASVAMEILVAVSAPTSLAIDFAHRSGITLVGFARPGRHNVYTFESRIHDT